MNWYKHYIGDYGRDTGTLTLTEHGAYLLMLQTFYATEQPLPTGKDLYRLLRCETDEDRAAVDKVSGLFFRHSKGGLVNARALLEIEKASDKAEANRRNGKSGGR